MSETHPTFVLSPGPHLHTEESTSKIMWWVNGSLAPAALWGVFVFGINAAFVILASIAGAVLTEFVSQKALGRRPTLMDGSAVCTGLLLALTVNPNLPAWQAFLGSMFAIGLGKMIFGGLGFNLFNPALLGRAFLMATFPLNMTSGWATPRPWFGVPLDAVTTATPLAVLKEQGFEAAVKLVSSPVGLWNALALGFRPGSIGEVSLLLVAIGGAALLARRIITLAIPLSVLAGVALSTLHTGVPMLHLMSGGLWIGAFYMATDYVTSPSTTRAQIAFGLMIGLLTGMIRVYGGYPEGICYAILIANAMAPALDLWFRPKRTAIAGSPS
jgi:electron transport complex protein RnfD